MDICFRKKFGDMEMWRKTTKNSKNRYTLYRITRELYDLG